MAAAITEDNLIVLGQSKQFLLIKQFHSNKFSHCFIRYIYEGIEDSL